VGPGRVGESPQKRGCLWGGYEEGDAPLEDRLRRKTGGGVSPHQGKRTTRRYWAKRVNPLLGGYSNGKGKERKAVKPSLNKCKKKKKKEKSGVREGGGKRHPPPWE